MSSGDAQDNAETPTDGRRQRSERSKHKIAQAMIDIIMGGDVTPSAEAVAARANVGLRSVFRHFKDMDSLFNEVSIIFHDEYLPDLAERDTNKDWKGQLQDNIDLRCEIFEKVMPMQQSSIAQKHRSKFVREEMARNHAMMKKALLEILPENIQSQEGIVEGLDALLSPAVWMRLRIEQNLSPIKAKKLIEQMADALLA